MERYGMIDYEREAIVGGEHHKDKTEYNQLIAQSIKEMYRVLKFDRWLSFVFAHQDPEFWHLIVETAESCGFEYKGAVPQKNGQTSFKKRQHPYTVLSGQLIINFQKVRNPKAIMKANLGTDIAQIIMQTIEGIIAKNHSVCLPPLSRQKLSILKVDSLPQCWCCFWDFCHPIVDLIRGLLTDCRMNPLLVVEMEVYS